MSQKMSKLFNCILLCLALASTVFLTACSDGGSTDADYSDASLYGTWEAEEGSGASVRRPTVSFLWNGEFIKSTDDSEDEYVASDSSVLASIKKSNVAKEAEKVTYGEPESGEWFCNKGKLKIKFKDEEDIEDAEYRVEGKTLSITSEGETEWYKKISTDSSNKSDVVGTWYLHSVDDDGEYSNDVLTVNSDGSFVYEDSDNSSKETGTWEYNRGMLRMQRKSGVYVLTLIKDKLKDKLKDTHSENVAVFGREVYYIPGAIR